MVRTQRLLLIQDVIMHCMQDALRCLYLLSMCRAYLLIQLLLLDAWPSEKALLLCPAATAPDYCNELWFGQLTAELVTPVQLCSHDGVNLGNGIPHQLLVALITNIGICASGHEIRCVWVVQPGPSAAMAAARAFSFLLVECISRHSHVR